MKIQARFDRSRIARRGAFTLIELMIVMTIIAALAALTASAVFKFMGTQQESNTQSRLDQTQSVLKNAWSKVKDQTYQQTSIPQGVLALAGADANATARAQILYYKLQMRKAFPMNFAEALNVPYNNPELANWGLPTTVPASPLQPLPGYVTYLASLGITSFQNGGTIGGPNYVPQPYESSACLLMALQRGVSGAGANPSELMSGGGSGVVNSNSSPALLAAWGPNVNVTFLADAWGRPILFSRFPTGCPVLNPNGPQQGANDPGDPLGYLNSSTWAQQAPQQQQLFSMLALQQLTPPSSPPTSYKLAPMVASGGQLNWLKPGARLTLDPITFTPGLYDVTTSAFAPTLGTGVLYSNP